MIRLANEATVKVKSLAEQKADFTAEGAPVPGHVAGSTTAKAGHTGAAPRQAHGAQQHEPRAKSP
jgi:hypothetical protein